MFGMRRCPSAEERSHSSRLRSAGVHQIGSRRASRFAPSYAEPEGFHVDAATDEENKRGSEISPITINATVWRGKNDDEPIASVMDGPDHLGLSLLTFSKSEETERTARFRDSVMRQIKARWPKTAAMPIMPTGATPLHEDLVLTKDGYRVKRGAASKYELPASSPLIAERG
jgi:hypothetical protein